MKLQEDETILHDLRPRPAILAIWFFSKCLPFGVWASTLAFTSCGYTLWNGNNPNTPVGTIFRLWGLAVLTAVALAFAYIVHLRRTYVYHITNQRCVFRGGILWKTKRSVPYHKVTDVETTQNIVEQVLGISNINLYTPGTASVRGRSVYGGHGAELRFVGLGDSEILAEAIIKKLKDLGGQASDV